MAQGSMSIGGIISGFDTATLVSQLMEVERTPVYRLNEKKTTLTAELTAWQDLNTRLLALSTQASALDSRDSLYPMNATSSDEDILKVTASSSASLSTYSVKVNQLAAAHKVASKTYTDTTTALGYSGDILINDKVITLAADDTLSSLRTKINNAEVPVTASILSISETEKRLILTSNQTGAGNAIDLKDANSGNILEELSLLNSTASIKNPVENGANSDLFSDSTTVVGTLFSLSTPPSGTVQIDGVNVDINLRTDSLSAIKDKINNASIPDVTADIETVEEDGTTHSRLKIVGASTPTFTDSGNIFSTLGILKKGIANQQQAAQDASVDVDNFEDITRSSNTITDLIEGVTLNLVNADDTKTITVQINPGSDEVSTAVNSFIEQFNNIMDFIAEQQNYDTETQTSGTLFGEFTLVDIQSSMRSIVSAPVKGLPSTLNLLSQVGVSYDELDHLMLNGSTLADALQNDWDGVAKLFQTVGVATDADGAFFSATSKTKPSTSSGYLINITAVATQATKTGNDISGGLTQSETLTFNGSTTVSLQSGWDTDQVVSAINNALNNANIPVTASNVGGAVKLLHQYYGSAQTVTVSSTVDAGAGTGLGGALALEVATYAGTDVAGTINGESATGDGQYLTGNEGNTNTEGLKLKITATSTGEQGTITLTKGVGAQIADYISSITDEFGGVLTNTQDSIQKEIDDIDVEKANLEERLEEKEERYWAKFNAMEAALGELQNQSSWLMSQISQLNGMFSYQR